MGSGKFSLKLTRTYPRGIDAKESDRGEMIWLGEGVRLGCSVIGKISNNRVGDNHVVDNHLGNYRHTRETTGDFARGAVEGRRGGRGLGEHQWRF